MQNAKLNVVHFNNNDVIATSGEMLVLSNLGNGVAGDATISYNGNSIYESNEWPDAADAASAINKALGINISINTCFSADSNNKYNLAAILYNDYSSGEDWSRIDLVDSAYNGTYKWNGSAFIKQTN